MSALNGEQLKINADKLKKEALHMSKFKKALLMCTSCVLVATLAIGGTIAYLTSKDSDVNVMTLGNVSIEQIEQERDSNGKLVDFSQGKPLYPAVFEGSSINWASEDKWVVPGEQAWKVVEDNANVLDKFVTVKNTGESNAYVRTLIAYEGNEEYGPNGAWIHVVTNGTNVTPQMPNNFVGYITVDGVDYTVYEYVYPVALAAGETSIPSLKQVYMNKAADNDVVAYYGETYDILVISQAVQTAGFADAKTALDTGFGKPSEKAAEWFEGIEIPDYVLDPADFAPAVAEGGNVSLCCDVEFGGSVAEPTTLSLFNNTLSSNGITVKNDLSMANGTYLMNNTSDYLNVRPTESDVYTFTNVDFINTYKRKPNNNTGTNRVEQILKLYPMAAGVKSTFIFENCTFENASVYFSASSDKPADIDVVFKNCTFNALGSSPVIEFSSTTTGTVTIDGCTFNIEGTYSNCAVIGIKTWSSITLDVTASNNTLNANKAVPYTFDPEKGETEVDTVKIGNVSSVRNYCLFDCLTGKYSTIVETGTILTGDIAIASK